MDEKTQDALEFINVHPGLERHALQHFMVAMKGHVSMPVTGTVGMPDEYSSGKWRVLNTHLTTPQSAYGGGSTVIWYGPVPVWTMQYLGYCEKEAIPCLRAALLRSYNDGKYHGGRGPEFFRLEDHTYVNRVQSNNFGRVTVGEETIYCVTGKVVGFHRYQALYMVRYR